VAREVAIGKTEGINEFREKDAMNSIWRIPRLPIPENVFDLYRNDFEAYIWKYKATVWEERITFDEWAFDVSSPLDKSVFGAVRFLL
jgi:hypothetical protein